LKKIGEELAPGDTLVEIETDKAQMDMECQEEGFLAKILIEGGAKDVSVNTVSDRFSKFKPICVLAENKEDVEKFANFSLQASVSSPSVTTPEVTPKDPKASTQPSQIKVEPVAPGTRIFISPLAKVLAAEKGISLSSLNGTGPDGRIVKNDVLSYKSMSDYFSSTAPSVSAAVESVQTSPATSSYTDIPLSNIRKVIANRLAESKSTIPHYYMTQEIDVSKVLK
jgi:pyruvate dehydrogenase E2 component (dihydrolipoamide acetyltransferase)